MYTAFYDLQLKPFQISSDPSFIWLGEKHKEALAVLRYGVLDNKGFLLLTGDVGTGKTTLLNSLIASLGDDVIYSGTVAAAMEGRFLGFPAVAVSLVTAQQPAHFETAAKVTLALLERLKAVSLAAETILNVNVPDLPWTSIRGFRSTRLGHRHKAEPVFKATDPRGHPIYWVGPPGGEQDAGEGTDFHALRNGFISVTPLKVDLTHHAEVPTTAAWLGELGQ